MEDEPFFVFTPLPHSLANAQDLFAHMMPFDVHDSSGGRARDEWDAMDPMQELFPSSSIRCVSDDDTPDQAFAAPPLPVGGGGGPQREAVAAPVVQVRRPSRHGSFGEELDVVGGDARRAKKHRMLDPEPPKPHAKVTTRIFCAVFFFGALA